MFLSIVPYLTILFFTSYQVQSNILLNNFNNIFLNTYQQTRASLLKTVDPLIITKGDTLTLIHRGKHTTITTTPVVFHNLKTISHIPFVIYLRLFNNKLTNRNLTSNELITLKSYLHEIRLVRDSLNISDFSLNKTLFQSQFDLIDFSINYLRSILQSKQLKLNKLKHFCRTSKNRFTLNLKIATRVFLDGLHATAYPWYTKLFNETERQTVQVLILGPKAPREGYIVKQYFEKLLGGKHLEGKRFLYAENLFDDQSALNVLGSWLLDTHAAEAFFDDQTRLHRDLLMDEGILYMKELF